MDSQHDIRTTRAAIEARMVADSATEKEVDMRIIFESEDAYDIAIREAKQDAWDEGAKWAAVEFAVLDQGVQFLAHGDNPYREEGGVTLPRGIPIINAPSVPEVDVAEEARRLVRRIVAIRENAEGDGWRINAQALTDLGAIEDFLNWIEADHG